MQKFLFVLFLVFCNAEELPRDLAANAQPFCNQRIMNSYMLVGKKIAVEEKNIVCKNVRKNCCRKDDQQRIYHMLKESLPSKIDQYEQKMRMALMKVERFYNDFRHREVHFKGSGEKKIFCIQQHRKMKDFPFSKLYNTIMDNIENVNQIVKNQYQTFPCILCDYEAHKYIQVKSEKVFMSSRYCGSIIGRVRGYMKAINVDLIELLWLIQNTVDCQHYKYSYDLKFFDQKAYENSVFIDKCIQNLNSVEYMKYCKRVCEQVEISRISRLIQGDYEFLERAVNIFEQLSSYHEEKAQITSKMNDFLQMHKNPRKAEQEDLKKQLLVSPGKMKKDHNKFFDKLMNEYDNISLDDIKFKFDKRILEEKKQEEQPTVRPLLEPKYIYSPDLEDFYIDISINNDVDHRIYKLQDNPIQFHELFKVFINGGINPDDYEGQQAIDIDEKTFYEDLYVYRERDPIDTKLQLLLADFTKREKRQKKERKINVTQKKRENTIYVRTQISTE